MSSDLIQYAFVAGEISDRLRGRSDLEKYDFGLARAHNWFVDYRGGISTRPGLIFGDYIQHADKSTRFFRFQFSPDTSNAYAVLFGHEFIRFIQDGGYVLETAKTITAVTQANPGVVTAAAHGYANGDWVKIFDVGGMSRLNARIFEVANVTTNTFELVDVHGVNYNTTALDAYTSGGTVQRIYTLTSPYTHTDLAKLKAFQIRDVLRLTHPDYPIKNLERSAHTTWTISDEVVGNAAARPTGLGHTSGTSGTAGVLFTITAVFADGTESLRSAYEFVDDTVNYSVTAGGVTLTWTPVANAVSYRIYRSIIVEDKDELNNAMQFGYIGSSVGPQFTDNNLIPDFAQGPPSFYNPFAAGGVIDTTITNGGSGYSNDGVTVAASGGSGSGFVGVPIVVGGAVVGIHILNSGKDYTSAPTLTISGGGGTGATATAEIGDQSGMFPATSTIFQQRQVYAGSKNSPLALWGSQPGQFSNFDTSDIIVSDDSFEFELDASTVAPIRHLMNMRGGLLVMSAAGIWQLTGGGNLAVTPTNAFAEPQTFFGAADVEPFNADTDILYVTEKESTVRLLSYNDFSKIYGGQDMSILSSHLFKRTNPIVRWSYAETPFRLVWCVLQDGTFLAFTLVKEQNVFAWTPCTTRGMVRDALTLVEDNADKTYVVVERYLNGKRVKMFEYFADREIDYVENAVCMDSALCLEPDYIDATLQPSAATGTITLTAGSSVFVSGDVGSIIRVGGGKVRITAYTSGTEVTGEVLREITEVIPESETPRLAAALSWSLDTPISSVSGLDHLEGETVKVLVDGNVIADKVVNDGTIALGVSGTRISVGLGFTCIAQTLPQNARDVVIEGRRKRTYGAAIRRFESRGLKYGPTLSKLYDWKERTTEKMGEPVQLQNDMKYQIMPGTWDVAGQMYIVQPYPLPASILGIIPSIEVGDDPN